MHERTYEVCTSKYFGFLVRTADSMISSGGVSIYYLAQDDRWMLLQLHATNIPGFQNHAFPHNLLCAFVWLISFTRAVANRDQDRSLASVSRVWLLNRSCTCPVPPTPQKLAGDLLFLCSVRQGGRYHPQGRPKAMCLGNRQCKAGISWPLRTGPSLHLNNKIGSLVKSTYNPGC